MAKCKTCGSDIFNKKVVPEFHDDLMGIPVIVMNAVEQESCVKCGTLRSTLIPNLEGLIAAIAVKRATMPTKLNGSELKFLRKALGWKAKELAEKLEVTPEAISRWENDQNPMNPQSEGYFRLIVCTLLKEKAPKIAVNLDQIVGMKIRPVRTAGSVRPLCFSLCRVPVTKNDNPDEQWQDKAA